MRGPAVQVAGPRFRSCRARILARRAARIARGTRPSAILTSVSFRWSPPVLCARLRCIALACAAAILCVLCASASDATTPHSQRVTVWTIADGLPQGTINALAQTPDGALWIATFGGLLRFDGIEFRTYDLDALAGLPTNRVTGLAVDGKDGLWVLTQSCDLIHLVDGVVTERVRPEIPPGKEALAVSIDATGALWERLSSGVAYRYSKGKWTIPAGTPGSVASYRGMCASPDGRVWLNDYDKLIEVRPRQDETARFAAPAKIMAIDDAHGDGPWLGLASGLARFQSGQIEPIAIEPPISGKITCILSDRDAGLWLGTTSGAVHVSPRGDGEAWIVDETPSLPDGFEVRSMLHDREGNLWLGSPGLGLARVTRHRVVHTGNGMRIEPVCALTSDGRGGAWIATEREGLVHQGSDSSRTSVSLQHPDLQSFLILSMLRDSGNRLWIGVRSQILRSQADGFVAIETLPKGIYVIGPMIEGAPGHVWIASEPPRLFELGPDDTVLQTLVVPGVVGSLSKAADGSIWIGTKGAALHLVGTQFERFGAEVGVPGGDVRDVLPEDDGTVWIASYGGGLGLLRDGHVTLFSRLQGMPDVSLSRVLDDGRGSLWMLSNRGIIIARKDDLIAVAENRARRFDPVVLGPEAGMPEGRFGSPSGFIGESGVVWFGTIDGAVHVDPLEFPFNKTPPVTRIEGVSAEDRPIAMGEQVEIPAGTRRVVIDFTAFALSEPERVHFRYRMQGLDDNWIDVGGQRNAVFTALKPGPYVFEAAARNEDGVWSETPARLHLERLPSWWETRLFQAAAVIAAAGLAFGLHKRRVHVVSRRSQVLLEAAENRRAAEENASRLREELEHVARVATAGELATSLAHEVNQPLAAIVANAQAGRRFLAAGVSTRAEIDEILADIAQQGVRASEVIKRLRGFLRKNPGEQRALDVDEEVRAALPLVRRELQDHQVEVRLDLDASSSRIVCDPVQLQQVLINLLKNACEALSSTSGPRLVTLRTRARSGHVEIEVRDTGPGLAPEVAQRLFQPFVTTKAKGMGLGLTICRSIAESHGGTLVCESGEQGTVFRIILPHESLPGVDGIALQARPAR